MKLIAFIAGFSLLSHIISSRPYTMALIYEVMIVLRLSLAAASWHSFAHISAPAINLRQNTIRRDETARVYTCLISSILCRIIYTYLATLSLSLSLYLPHLYF